MLGLVLAVLAGLGAVGGWVYYARLSAGIDREDPFAQLNGRPAKEVKGALNILVLGSDTRDPDNTRSTGEWRTDTMILMHIPASHDKVVLVNFPRDLYVQVPRSQTNKKLGGTKAKLNAAYAWGGLPLTVQTVEDYTKVRVDHVIMLDFGGFKQVTDAVGGVDMYIEETITSIHPPKRRFKKGMNHLNGTEALDYVRQRYQFPDGDFARMRHQQQFMKALLDKAVSSGTVTNPARLNAFLQSVTKAMTVDKGFSLVDVAMQFRDIRSEDLIFMVSPHLGGKQVNGEDVVMPDPVKATALYDAIRRDKAQEWLNQSSPAPTPGTGAASTKPGR